MRNILKSGHMDKNQGHAFGVCRVYDDNCRGCQPCLMNMETREKYPENSLETITLRAIWKGLTLDEKQAYHRAAFWNSLDPQDLKIVRKITDEFKQRLERAIGN